VNARVERLISWSDERRLQPQKWSIRSGLALALGTLTVCAAVYSQLLSGIHTATEWLMR
jgi:hypothetical protein